MDEVTLIFYTSTKIKKKDRIGVFKRSFRFDRSREISEINAYTCTFKINRLQRDSDRRKLISLRMNISPDEIIKSDDISLVDFKISYYYSDNK